MLTIKYLYRVIKKYNYKNIFFQHSNNCNVTF